MLMAEGHAHAQKSNGPLAYPNVTIWVKIEQAVFLLVLVEDAGKQIADSTTIIFTIDQRRKRRANGLEQGRKDL
jgi:hypothetical protein